MKKPLLILCAIALLYGCQQPQNLEATRENPNIIFIMADDLGYADVGPYGQTKIQTPNIDKLAAEGMKFTQFYAGTSVCAPSRAVLMTGLHTGHVEIRGNKQYGIRNGQQPLTPGVPTIATVLKDAGYTTGMIGKWGLGNPDTPGNPKNHGFDYFFGYTDQILAHNYWPEYLWRNDEKVFLKNEVHYLDTAAWHDGLGSYSTKKVAYSHDLFVEDALSFIDKNQDTSFMLYLPFTIPHDNGEQADSMRFEVPSQGIYADKDWTKKEKDYAAMITKMDEGIGEIMEQLKSLGLDENTIVFFTSDNGPMRNIPTTAFFDSNGPLRGGKRDLYEGGIREPFIVRWPGKVQAGTTSDFMGAFWDVLPTFTELSRQPIPENLDGISFLPTLLGEENQETHKFLYWEFHEGTGSQAIRQGKWKAVRLDVKTDNPSPLELYDLSQDIGEENNIADEFPEKVRELDSLMKVARTPSDLFVLSVR